MTNNWKEEDLSESEAVEAIQEEDQTAETPKRRVWPFLLLILILGGAAFILYAPEAMKERYLDPLKQWLPDGQKEVSKKMPAKPKPAQPPAPAIKPAPAINPAPVVEPKPVVIERIVPASSEEINRALNAMNMLQGELTTLRQQQQALEQQQRAVQLMQLRTRLNWITNSTNHLPQLQLAWEEISLMPVLTSDERNQAQAMLKLAQEKLNQLQSWQQLLHRTAESLTRKEHDNIIPAFENSWLNWIASQFSVRHSLSREEADDASLQETLINTSRNIEMEVWPESRAWLELRARLQLRLIAGNEEETPTENLAVQLPESFDAIRSDIDTLRSTAAVWLERL